MDLHTLERLGHERQQALLQEAEGIRQARILQAHILQAGRLRLARPSPLRLRLAYWLRAWARHLDRQGAPEPAADPGC